MYIDINEYVCMCMYVYLYTHGDPHMLLDSWTAPPAWIPDSEACKVLTNELDDWMPHEEVLSSKCSCGRYQHAFFAGARTAWKYDVGDSVSGADSDQYKALLPQCGGCTASALWLLGASVLA